jgi:hypothetical protein
MAVVLAITIEAGPLGRSKAGIDHVALIDTMMMR